MAINQHKIDRQEQQIIDDIASARRALENAEARMVDLREAKSMPARPSSGDRFTMNVRFPGNSKTYEFLVLRVNDMWYTTGTTSETKCFPSWQSFVRWVREETFGGVVLAPLIIGNTPLTRINVHG